MLVVVILSLALTAIPSIAYATPLSTQLTLDMNTKTNNDDNHHNNNIIIDNNEQIPARELQSLSITEMLS